MIEFLTIHMDRKNIYCIFKGCFKMLPKSYFYHIAFKNIAYKLYK